MRNKYYLSTMAICLVAVIIICLCVGCKEKKTIHAIISGSDTMITTGGLDVIKCSAAHGYWNYARDTFFTVFTNSIKDGSEITPYYMPLGVKFLLKSNGQIYYLNSKEIKLTNQ